LKKHIKSGPNTPLKHEKGVENRVFYSFFYLFSKGLFQCPQIFTWPFLMLIVILNLFQYHSRVKPLYRCEILK